MIAFLSLGSNLGNRWRNLDSGLVQLQRNHRIELIDVSPVYETEPFGEVPQSSFLNLVAAVEAGLPAADLLADVLAIENRLGRIREMRWGPRIIDIDILTYDTYVCRSQDLVLPHPGIWERRFVLRPWCDIASGYRVPVVQKTVSELLESCPDNGWVHRIG